MERDPTTVTLAARACVNDIEAEGRRCSVTEDSYSC